ncbi:hypothetical protein M011DRAFT_376061, partial [Sporormia fimetaria CBS 119925]
MASRATSSTTTGADDSSSSAPQPKASKRRCVPSACVPCRKRKSKCDGGTPVCATCTAVYKSQCYYDEASEARRGKATGIKREQPDPSADADYLVKAIRTAPEPELRDLLQHLRKDPRSDVSALADSWRKLSVTAFSPSSENAQQSLENDLSVVMGKPARTRSGESRHYGHSSNLGLVSEDEDYNSSKSRSRSRSAVHPSYAHGTWTTVTDDMAFVEYLLKLYFDWSHAFYYIFSCECFWNDFYHGREKYCSSLLVNALLAYACHFTDDPRARVDKDDPRTAGEHFFAEARRLLYEDETPSLTTTQALCVMAMREPSAGRDSSGFMYIGRCMRMAIELGMHLNTTSSPELGLSKSEIEVRRVTFWGCFIVDTVWTLCIGRVADLPRAAITVEKPSLEESAWTGKGSYPLANPGAGSRMFIQEFAKFAELINDANLMYFAPKERVTKFRVLSMYEKYQAWYANLPGPLRLDQAHGAPLPHILVLYMLYHTVILHLFRPLLKVDIIDSKIRPRDICTDSANKVSDLLRVYRQHYDLRACQLIMSHCLLSVGIVHLLYSQNHIHEDNLVECLQALEDLSICHYFGARSFRIVHSLAKTWDLAFPEKLRMSKLVPKDDAPVGSPGIENMFYTRSTAQAAQEMESRNQQNFARPMEHSRRNSLSMFSSENQPYSDANAPAPMPMPTMYGSQHISNPTSTNLQYPNLSTAPLGPSQSAESLFWTPVPGVGVPILPRDYATSPMDINTMVTPDEWERFSRDGFRMNDSWMQNNFMYPASNVNMGMHHAGMNMGATMG